MSKVDESKEIHVGEIILFGGALHLVVDFNRRFLPPIYEITPCTISGNTTDINETSKKWVELRYITRVNAKDTTIH